MSEHTPTPWRADAPRKYAGVTWDNIIRSERRNDPVCTVFVAGYMEREAAANAAFIVKAVNSHDALVKALQEIANSSPIPVSIARQALASIKEHS